MTSLAAQITSNFNGAFLPEQCRRTYVRHFAYSILDAAAVGILANAPIMALKGMGSPDWQMSLQLSISSVGMFIVLYLSGRMAVSRKKPFMLIPGFAYAACSLLMALTENVLLFLILLGLGTLFEVITRPALTAIIRLNYPATHRGAATGQIRKWHALTFLLSSLLSARALDWVTTDPALMIRGQMILAGLLSAAGFFVFRNIVVKENADELIGDKPSPLKHFRQAWRIVAEDARFRRYLLIAFLYAFGGLMYVSFIPVFLVRDLQYSYTGASLLTHIVPSLVAFALTGLIGGWVDRVNTWKAWALIRLGWGLDPFFLALTPVAMVVFPPAVYLIPLLGRLSRGAVMGGSWILWWQLAVNHFAPPGGDTTRYMGIIIFMNGLCRLFAPLAGAWLLERGSITFVLLIGGSLVLLTSLLSIYEFKREQSESRYDTIDRFEKSYTEQD